MNISEEVWFEAKKRGLDWEATGGSFDYVYADKKGKFRCHMTLAKYGASPELLKEPCEVTIALHEPGYCSIGIQFGNVRDALDFMARSKGLYFLPDVYKTGKEEAEANKRRKE